MAKAKLDGVKNVAPGVYVTLDLRTVRGNRYQSRTNVLPGVEAAGWGVFQAMESHPDNKPLWELLLSKSPEDCAQGVQLIQKYDPGIAELAGSLQLRGQFQNVGITPFLNEGGRTVPGAWTVVWGMQRCLAKAYMTAQSLGKLPAVIEAKVVDKQPNEVDFFWMSYDENARRRNETPVDHARFYAKLKKMGLTLEQIGEQVGEDKATVKMKLQILQLSQEDQDKIAAGRLPYTRAIINFKAGMANGEDQESDGSRVRTPSKKALVARYEATERPEDIAEEEWALLTEPVRRWIAFHLLKEYESRQDMRRRQSDADRVKHEAAKVEVGK